MIKNILICGIGGQGQLTLAKLLGEASLRCRKNVVIAETRGLSQRGGSVAVYVRIGDEVYAPLFEKANIMLALELIEAVRNIGFVARDTLAIVNNDIIKPNIPSVNVPPKEKLIEALRKATSNLFLVNATYEALRIGSPKSLNMVILGFLTGLNALASIGVNREHIIQAFRSSKYYRFRENVEAFKVGERLAKNIN